MHECRALCRILYAPYRAKSIRDAYVAIGHRMARCFNEGEVSLECCEVEAILQLRYEAAGADLFFDSSRKSLRCIRLAVSHEN